MRIDRDAFRRAERIGEEAQPSLGAEFRVKQLERAGRRIARVGQNLFAGLLAFLVKTCEVGPAHIDLAAPRTEPADGQCEPQRYTLHRHQVVRHVVAVDAVAARRAELQQPVDIGKRNGYAVDLQFHDITHRRLAERL